MVTQFCGVYSVHTVPLCYRKEKAIQTMWNMLCDSVIPFSCPVIVYSAGIFHLVRSSKTVRRWLPPTPYWDNYKSRGIKMTFPVKSMGKNIEEITVFHIAPLSAYHWAVESPAAEYTATRRPGMGYWSVLQSFSFCLFSALWITALIINEELSLCSHVTCYLDLVFSSLVISGSI